MREIIEKVSLRKYQDKRGSLVENTLKRIVTGSKHFFVSKSRPGAVRGNHYHKRKSEWFYLIQGTCRVRAVDLQTKQGEDLTLKDDQNLIVRFGPNIAHAFKNIGKEEMILLALVNEVHDQSDPDTFRYKTI